MRTVGDPSFVYLNKHFGSQTVISCLYVSIQAVGFENSLVNTGHLNAKVVFSREGSGLLLAHVFGGQSQTGVAGIDYPAGLFPVG